MTEDKEKFNEFMSESRDNILCFTVTKPISEEGYRKNFRDRMEDAIKDYGSVHILVYFKDYKGWEIAAAKEDLATICEKGSKIQKLAIVKPSIKDVLNLKLRDSLIGGDVKFYDEDELDEAMAWVFAK